MTATVPLAEPRMTWMDAARGVAVLLVVILHGATIPMSTGAGSETWVEINRYIEPVRMPLLLFLSGMLLPRSLAKPLPQFLRGKLEGIAWPLLVWMILYGVLVFRNSVFDPGLWRSGDYLWFLFVVLGCYLIGTLARWVPALIIALVMVAIMTAIPDPPMHRLDMKLLYYGAFFFFGAGLGRFVPRWSQAPVWIGALVTLGAAWLCFQAADSLDLRRGNAVAAGISLMCLAAMLWWLPRLPSNRGTAWLEWFGRHSIVVYVAHFPLMILVHRTMDRVDVAPWVHIGFCTMVTLLLVTVLTMIRPQTSWLYTWPRQLSTRSANDRNLVTK